MIRASLPAVGRVTLTVRLLFSNQFHRLLDGFFNKNSDHLPPVFRRTPNIGDRRALLFGPIPRLSDEAFIQEISLKDLFCLFCPKGSWSHCAECDPGSLAYPCFGSRVKGTATFNTERSTLFRRPRFK